MTPMLFIALLVAVSVVGAVIAGLAISKAMGRSAESRQVSDRLQREGYVGVAFVRDRKRKGIHHGTKELYRFELEVEGVDGSRFPGYAEEFLPRVHKITNLGHVLAPPQQYGEETSLIPVRYLPGEPRVAFEPVQSPDAQEALARYNGRRGLTG